MPRKRKEYARCPRCGRILFPDPVTRRIPRHRVPPPGRRPGTPGQPGTVPLTGKDSKWCSGGGDW